ncbi:heavy metal translocating P-type ATPase [Gracilimonas sediminicola]|jgi:Cd2+/Zn2+-exporting ATPase|uniref:P-type Zn(2+) transporter n=1 Tax=Gracilimonas sediminicola TaxID=2952158 RepID=A0A9X2L646_9BACT|nr:heavy metal translocating P-type ATPase [Gracilimonas sediminicola]MCP9293042.1 heavy metal translocating P-type ATPase [Gracilimonas sediminicola]
MEKLTLDIPVILPDIPDHKDKCVSRLIGTLEGRDGVDRVHIKTDESKEPKLCIHFDPETISLKKIKTLAQQTGAKLHDIFGHMLVKVNGIRHSRHARSITRQLRDVDGVVDAYASATGWIRLEYKKGDISREKLTKIIRETGLDIEKFSEELQDVKENNEETNGKEKKPETDHEHSHKEEDSHDHDHGGIFGEKTELIFSLICGSLLGIGFGLSYVSTLPGWVSLALYVSSYFFGGFYLVQEAYTEVKAGNFEIDFLMLVAAIGAAILGEWAEGALLLFLFSLGHSLEHYAMGRARDAIKGLSDLAPKTALRKKDGTTEEVSVEELQVGDVIVIKPNSKISADGVVINGESSVNQAPITGESVPVDKMEYDDPESIDEDADSIDDKHRVFAGTINGNGSLEVKVTKLSKDSTLSRLIKLVNEAEAQKSPTQQFTDKFEKYFVPSVLVLVVILNFAFLVIDESFSASFYRAMAVLVAASPCALAISTPSAVLSGVGRAARGGVLIKGGRPLENLGILKALAFDKTGTLTEGEPRLTDVITFGDTEENELLKVAVAVESLSDHPLADAVVRDGKEKLGETDFPEAEDLESITGRGVKATIKDITVYIGNAELFEEADGIKLSEDLKRSVEELEGEGKTTMIVRHGDRYLGMLGLMDTPREDAKEVIQKLRDMGLTHLIMLTGDNQRVADAVAKEIGIDDPKGNLLPEDKVEAVKKLREEEGDVAMVGDGVNDAPAMANSTVGIAMGAAGSDVALETADVALMADKISVLPFAIGLSRKTKSIIKQNLWISLGMVALLVPATIFGLSMGWAVIGHEGSTVVVVFNALRLLAYKS